MDLMTIVGILGAVTLLVMGIGGAAQLRAFLSFHGLLIVVGGTFAATMINSSFQEIRDAVSAGFSIFFKPKHISPEEIVGYISRLASKARQLGPLSIQDEGKDAEDDGFLAHAIEICVSSHDESLARVTLEREINHIRMRHREVGNIFRTSGLLSPMFGLLGTLIGIINVLRNIAEPESVGPAMAVAISSAFFGILLANLIFVPGAGKLRTRSIQEVLSKEMIMEGLMDVVFSDRIPVIIEMRLLSYLRTGTVVKEPDKAPAAAPAPS